MSWSRRPEKDTPRMEQREFQDDRGRTWIGSVTSGSLHGGEDHAEIVFTCRDAPAELKRVARLDIRPTEAGERWPTMSTDELRDVFGESDPA